MKPFLSEKAPRVLESFQTCKKVVSYLKRSGLSRHLSETVKVMIEVRWNSACDTNESMIHMIAEIIEVLTKQNELHRYGEIHNRFSLSWYTLA